MTVAFFPHPRIGIQRSFCFDFSLFHYFYAITGMILNYTRLFRQSGNPRGWECSSDCLPSREAWVLPQLWGETPHGTCWSFPKLSLLRHPPRTAPTQICSDLIRVKTEAVG